MPPVSTCSDTDPAQCLNRCKASCLHDCCVNYGSVCHTRTDGAHSHLCRHAALPAAVATGLQYSQTHTFLPVHLPTANAVPTILWMMAPVVLLDLFLWNIAPHMNLGVGVKHGLHQYHMQKAETHRHQCMRLPPIQHNFSRLALSTGRQFLLAMSMPGA